MTQNKKRYFEWIDGDDKGNVVSLETISELDGEVFYNFDDGESCNLRFISKMTNNILDLKNKFMVEVENPHNIWTFEPIETKMPFGIEADKGDQVPTLHDFMHSDRGGSSELVNIENSDLGKDKLVPPRRMQQLRPLPKSEDYADKNIIVDKKPTIEKNETVEPVVEPVAEPVVEQNSIKKENVDENQSQNKENVEQHNERKCERETTNVMDPVAILVDSCKKHDTEIPLTITIQLPTKSLYAIADNEFENGGDKFIDYIVSKIDTDAIVNSLKGALKSAYENTNEE